MGMCKWFFRDATKIQNGRQRSSLKFFVGAKTLKLIVRNDSNFTITFPIIWRCASDFFKVLLKFKMAATDQLYSNSFGQFCLVNFFFLILTSHSWQHGDVQVIFKDATKIQNGSQRSTPNFFVGAKNLKVRNYSNFTITFPTIWRCASDFFRVLLKFKIIEIHYPPSGNVHVILLKFKMATTNQIFKYLWPQKVLPNLWRGMI